MGRHVNFEDEQDRWLNKADKLNRNNKKEIPLMELNFNDMVTLKDQLEWIRLKKRQTEKERLYGKGGDKNK
jgi:hypothetical protein